MRPNAGIGIQPELKPQGSEEHEGSTPSSGTFNPFDTAIVKVYGPYRRRHRDGKDRNQVVIVLTDRVTTMSHARWLMTQSLRRRLSSEETVDHKNEDPLDDSLKNLQLLSPAANIRKSSKGKASPLRGKEKGWVHGTIYAWMKKKCACSLCAEARRSWYDARNLRRRTR